MTARPALLPSHGRLYVCGVILVGTAIIFESVRTVVALHLSPQWLTLAALTLLSGSATVRLPSVPATISISETFVFTSVLLFGPAAGATIVALDGLIISIWFATRRRELYRIAFNMAAPATSIWVAAQIYFAFPKIEPLVYSTDVSVDGLVLPLLAFTVSHFLLNSWLIALAVHFETKRDTLDIWRRDFLWLSLNYFGGASVSALLVVYTRDINVAYLGIIVPLLLILYFTFRIPMARVEDTNRHLTKLNTLYLSTIETLAHAIDAKDQVTHGHIRRVQLFTIELARFLGITDAEQIKAIEASALLHDMGKLAVPEHILNKPGRLTAAEFEKMKLHASIGADILSSIEFPYPVVPIVRHHHENWDGSGYPDGLSGTDIPIGARILSVVDCYDALTSDRPYRPRMSTDDAIAILRERRGTMYDPLVVDAFITIQPSLAVEDTAPSAHRTMTSQHEAQTQPRHVLAREATADPMSTYLLREMLIELEGLTWDCASDLLLTRIVQAINADGGAVFAYNNSSDELIVSVVYGDCVGIKPGLRLRLGEGVAGWIAAQKRPIKNAQAAIERSALGLKGERVFSSILGVPLLQGSQLRGVLCAYHASENAFDDAHQKLLAYAGQYVASAIGRDHSLAQDAPLMRVPTARHLDQYLERFLAVNRAAPPLQLLVLRTSGSLTTPFEHDRHVKAIRRCLDAGDMVFVGDAAALIVVPADQSSAGLATTSNSIRDGFRRQSIDVSITSVAVPKHGIRAAQLLEWSAKNALSSRAHPTTYQARRIS